VGGYYDNNYAGAAWIFTRSGGTWTQQGNKLVCTGAYEFALQGCSVAISADGNTVIVGGSSDNNGAGAAWVYTRSGGTWTQQGSKLVGTGAFGNAEQGSSVAISADGNTAIVGGEYDNNEAGAAWIFTRSGGIWTQQGSKLVGTGATGSAYQGRSVAISADGNTAIVGGFADNNGTGAAWVFVGPSGWTGSYNTDWATTGNWSANTIPAITDNVIINNVTNQPIIGNSTTATVNNLTINNSAAVTVNGALQIAGTIANNGLLNASSGSVTLNGSSAQTTAGSGTTTIQNLTINNPAGVTLGTALTVTGTITPKAGLFTTGGYLTLASSLTGGSASIAPIDGITNTGSFSADSIRVQRYVGSNIAWRMIGFPFTKATTISESALANFYTSGYSAYTYNEGIDDGHYGNSGGTNAGWTAFTNGSISSSQGLLLSGGTIPSTISFSGPINTGNQTIALNYTSANTHKGWNLIANPFASNIDWNTIQPNNTSNLDNAIYRYDPNTTAYATYVNGSSTGHQSNVIENGAGFFVHSIGATSLTIKETDKTSSAPSASLMGFETQRGTVSPDGSDNTTVTTTDAKSIIKLSLSKQGDLYGDEAVVRWGVDPATDNFDSKYDAYDMGRSAGPDLSVVGTDGTAYSIFHGSALLTKDKEQRVIGLGIKNMEEGSYTISSKLLSSMYDANEVYLIDHYTNETALVSADSAVYNFQVSSDPLSASVSRFSIAFNYKKAINASSNGILLLNNPSSLNQFNIVLGADYQNVNWELIDNTGRVLQSGLFNDVKKGAINTAQTPNLLSGSYFIKLIGDSKTLPTQKWIKE